MEILLLKHRQWLNYIDSLPTAWHPRGRYEEKYGKERVASMEKTVLSVGDELGIKFMYDGVISSTLDVSAFFIALKV